MCRLSCVPVLTCPTIYPCYTLEIPRKPEGRLLVVGGFEFNPYEKTELKYVTITPNVYSPPPTEHNPVPEPATIYPLLTGIFLYSLFKFRRHLGVFVQTR